MTSPKPGSGHGINQIEAFLRAVRHEVGKGGRAISYVAKVIDWPAAAVNLRLHDKLDDWRFYQAVLQASEVDDLTIKRLREAWLQLHAGRQARQYAGDLAERTRRLGQDEPSVVPMSASELYAGSISEFIELLRRIQVRSGLNPAKVAERAGIPRSTAYRFVDAKRNAALPTKPTQVKAFVEACSLPTSHVQRVMNLWTSLCEARTMPATESNEAMSASGAGRDQAKDMAAAPPPLERIEGTLPTAAESNLLDDIKRYVGSVAFFAGSAVSVAAFGLTGGWELFSTQPILGVIATLAMLILYGYGLVVIRTGRSEGKPTPHRYGTAPVTRHWISSGSFAAAPAVIGLEEATQDRILVDACGQ